MAILYGAAEPYARLVHEQLDGCRHPAQRRRRPHARRERARALAARPARAPRPRLPPSRRDGAARAGTGLVPRAARSRRRAGSGSAAPRASCAGGIAVGRTARASRRRRSKRSWPRSSRSPTANLVPAGTSTELDAARDLDARSSPSSATPSPPVRSRVSAGASSSRLGTAARARVPRPRRTPTRRWPEAEQRAADKVEAALERLAGLDAVEPRAGPRRVPPHARARARCRPRARGSARRRHPRWATSRSGSASTSTACSCAVSPRAPSPTRVRDDSLLPDADRRATDGAIAPARRPRRRRPSAPARRARRGAATRVLLFPAGDLRRTTDRMPSRFLLDTVEALAGTRLYADDLLQLHADWFTPGAVVRRRASRACRSPPPSRNTGCARCSTTPGDGGHVATSALRATDHALGRGLDCTLARGERRVHALRRQPRRPPGAEPGRRRRGRVAHAARDVGHVPARLLHGARPAGRDPGAPRGASTSSRPSTAARSCTTVLDQFLARCSRGPAARRRRARRGPTPTAPASARSPTRSATSTRPRAHGAPRVLGPRPPPHPRRPRPLPRRRTTKLARRARAHDHRHRAAASAFRADERPGGRGRAVRRAHACGSAARPTASTAPPTAALSSSTTRPGPRRRASTRPTPRRRAPGSSSPCTRARPRGAFGDRRHTRGRGVLVRQPRGEFRLGRARARRRRRGPRSTTCCASIVDGIEHGVFPCSLDPPELVALARGARTPTPTARGTRDRYREWERKRGAPELAAYVALAEPPSADEVDEPPTVNRLERRRDPNGARMTSRARAGHTRRRGHGTRAAIVDDLGDTLFVEAGAGSGKTKSLVDRVVALVTQSGVPMREIAAVTFTEKAAAELRDRIRRRAGAARDELAARARSRRRPRSPRPRSTSSTARAVSTLHAFAQRLLVENPIEAGLPPRVDVLDDIGVAGRVRRAVDAVRRPAARRPRARAHAAARAERRHRRSPVLRTIALACNANWDLVQERMGPEPDPPPLRPRPRSSPSSRSVCALASACTDPDDRLADRLAMLDEWLDSLRQRTRRVRAAPTALRRPRRRSPGNAGRQGNWPSTVRRRTRPRAARRGAHGAGADHRDHHRGHDPAAGVGDRAVHAREADERRRNGRLEFHDLLVLARAVLRDPEHGWHVRRRLRARYTHLLLDEFQDTDPDPVRPRRAPRVGRSRRARAQPLGRDRRSSPGACSSSATPKQSIYRFRRADIAAFLRARSAFGGRRRGTSPATSAPSRRSSSSSTTCSASSSPPTPESQPEYVALEPVRGDARSSRPGGDVLLGADPHEGRPRADALRHARPPTSLRPSPRALADGWSVVAPGPGRHRVVGAMPPRRHLRSCCPRARRSVSSRTRSTPPASRTGPRRRRWSTAHARSATCSCVLHAVDDPTDELALVTALALAAVRLRRRRPLHVPRRPPRPLEPPGAAPRVAAARPSGRRGDAGARRRGTTRGCGSAPSELLDRIVRERRVLEVGVRARAPPRPLAPRAVRHRPGPGVLGVRSHRRRAGRPARLPALGRSPERRGRTRRRDRPARDRRRRGAHPHHPRRQGPRVPDHDRVRHDHRPCSGAAAACSCSSRTTPTPTRSESSTQVTTEEFERYKPIDEQMDFHEKLRLLYVALDPRPGPPRGVGAPQGARSRRRRSREVDPRRAVVGSRPAAAALHRARRGRRRRSPRRCRSRSHAGPVPRLGYLGRANAPPRCANGVARTRLVGDRARATLAAERGERSPTPAWPRTRATSSCHRGTRGATAPRSAARCTPCSRPSISSPVTDVDETAAAQAAAEGVIGREHDIAALAGSARSPPARCARPLPATTTGGRCTSRRTVEGHTLEGYVDLVYRTADGLVVVDYKTDAWRDESDLDAKLARYRLQGASYALTLEAATGERVGALRVPVPEHRRRRRARGH